MAVPPPATTTARCSRRTRRIFPAKQTPLISERERDVLFEALHGRTVEGVAETLFLPRDTVKTYLSRAYARAGVNNKQAVLKLIDEWELRD